MLTSRLMLSLGLTALLALPADALETRTLQTSQIPVFYDLEATLEAVNESTISAQTSGAIQAVHVDINDRVKKGTLLIEIDNTQQQAQLAQAEAQLAQAEAQNEDAQILLKRNQRLLKQGTISQGLFDSAEAQAKSTAAAVAAANANVRQARTQLSYTRVIAPYSGIVKARMVQVGELVNPGQPMMTGLALQPLRAVADLPQSIASHFQASRDQASQAATAIQVLVGDQMTPISADKITLYPYADARYHSVRLRAELPADDNRHLYPGMWARVRLPAGAREGILIPQSAIVRHSEVTSVYILDGKQLKMRQVRLGNSRNGEAEVLAGLVAGDIIAIDGYAALAAIAQQAVAATSNHAGE
ncbi:efflux RND transporter periplasmic adaptor subunit [Oceanobacter antarcticus]|jgi:RND family efflux transporter MFP subunit|uniref:Efflux RND transporter periplasmic adaptor subunit n=1 Tax=Oceanobacter antarcticus TaxID=3133425 RepID=A0ABW8NN88_9GAMM|tara:strand:+ start:1824 stop:2900 length:1077 start_codon:yes stop_codon:yes gene_type:complete